MGQQAHGFTSLISALLRSSRHPPSSHGSVGSTVLLATPVVLVVRRMQMQKHRLPAAARRIRM